MKILVAQLGARRHYLVPAALEQAGALQRLATDYYSVGFLGSVLQALPLALAARARTRSSADLPSVKVSSFPLLALMSGLESRLSARSSDASRRWMRTGERFAKLCRRHLNQETTHVYAFTSAAKELFEAASTSGKVRILDHATAPRKHEMKLVSEEHERYPAWALESEQDFHLDQYHQRQLAEAQLASIVICNSTFAKRTLLAEGVAAEKVVAVPLGVRLPVAGTTFHRERRAHSGLRVLYVGSEGLRKGVPYLVRALGALASTAIEARFVGNLGLSPHGMSEVHRVGEVCGDVPRAQMEAHFDWADVLVLPSISDTFGLVILEAMARGVPVVASDHTGGPDVLRERVDGFVVPIRNSEVIASRLHELASSPEMLAEMSRNAAARAYTFSIDAYRARLIEAIGVPLVSRGNPSEYAA